MMKIAMHRLIAIVPIMIILAGCATPEQQAARAVQEVDQMVLVYGPACRKLGFTANTDPWRNCLIGLSQKDAAATAAGAYIGPPYWRYPY